MSWRILIGKVNTHSVLHALVDLTYSPHFPPRANEGESAVQILKTLLTLEPDGARCGTYFIWDMIAGWLTAIMYITLKAPMPRLKCVQECSISTC